MPLSKALIAELEHEAARTRKVLNNLPIDNFTWAPHEKSSKLGSLAMHIAQLPEWTPFIVTGTEVNVANKPMQALPVESKEQILEVFEKNIAAAKAVLQDTSDEDLEIKWTLKAGDHVIANMPRKAAIRYMVMNHIVHHRAQLGVYLRLNDLPVPGLYGPSADEK